jgi:hypothetical protein
VVEEQEERQAFFGREEICQASSPLADLCFFKRMIYG